MPPAKNYDYDPEKVFCPNPYDYSYPNVTEKVLGLSSEFYDKLVKGLTDVTISTSAGLEGVGGGGGLRVHAQRRRTVPSCSDGVKSADSIVRQSVPAAFACAFSN
jgi:hypothetical protein